MIKLLVVDDSALMRKYLTEMFKEEGDFEIFSAFNGKDALDKIKENKPDVITMDINMPEMDGITCLSHIMNENPIPVVMVSSLTDKDAEVTLEALSLGAVDYVTKPGGSISVNLKDIQSQIVQKVRAATRSRLRPPKKAGVIDRSTEYQVDDRQRFGSSAQPIAKSDGNVKGVVLIGAASGGPQAVEDVLSALPANFGLPVVVAQHMMEGFTKTFADRLNRICKLPVVEVGLSDPLENGKIYIGKAGTDVVLRKRLDKLTVAGSPAIGTQTAHPSIDKLVDSAGLTFEPKKTISVLLSGNGNDGVKSISELRKRGGRSIAESEDSAVMFAMPRELINAGGAEFVIASSSIGRKLTDLARLI